MDEFGTVSQSDSNPVPDQLRGLFLSLIHISEPTRRS